MLRRENRTTQLLRRQSFASLCDAISPDEPYVNNKWAQWKYHEHFKDDKAGVDDARESAVFIARARALVIIVAASVVVVVVVVARRKAKSSKQRAENLAFARSQNAFCEHAHTGFL